VTVTRIISGGQTGVDRGALLAARDLGLMRGGWAPRGWRAEDGAIPAEFRDGMKESRAWYYPYRTRLNVEDGDGTLVLSFEELTADSGSMLTTQIARKLGKRCLHMTIDKMQHSVGAAIVRGWLMGSEIRVLNVAGPRESKAPGIQEQSRAVLVALLGGTK
jgi:hypothetical protein